MTFLPDSDLEEEGGKEVAVGEGVDELFTAWRYRHVLMVSRMIGRKIGTGGSTGSDYLNKTAEKHRIFSDITELTTFLIPRSALPELPKEIKDELNFYFHVREK